MFKLSLRIGYSGYLTPILGVSRYGLMYFHYASHCSGKAIDLLQQWAESDRPFQRQTPRGLGFKRLDFLKSFLHQAHQWVMDDAA